MSIIEAKTTVATLSAATRKAFSAVPINDILHGAIFREGVTDMTTIKPSDIRMSSAAAITALGGKMSPQSFVLGMVFAVVRYAHGNQIDATLLPEGSKVALNASLSVIKKGAGISALSLETAVLAGIKALLALPAPTAKKKPAALPVTSTITTMPENLNRLTLRAGIARRSESAVNDCDDDGNFNPHHVSALAKVETAKAEAAKAADLAAKAADLAAKAAQFERDAESSAETIVATVTSRRDAEAIARAIAKSLGFRLVKEATTKKSA